jgi:S-adenosylmethionine/arginine decarboxylase-like enzyme
MLAIRQEMALPKSSDEEVTETFKRTGAWGLVVNVDLKECDPEIIRNPDKIHEFIVRLCEFIGMKRFGEPTIVHFGQNDRVSGYSMMQLIETSLVSGHFANETNAAYLDIFSCKEYPPEKTARFCQEFFQAASMDYNTVLRM